MHERQAALIGTLVALMFLAAAPARAERDAASRAQEGEINHWIEYYRKNQPPQQALVPAQQAAKGKEESEKVKGESEKGKR